jgi:protein-tyrosine phosphatase
MDDALEGLERMVERGFRTVVTTPHLEGSLTLHPERLRARLDALDDAFEDTRARALDRWEGLSLSRSNEVALDHPGVDLSEPRLRLGTGSFTLVEWPRLQVPPGATQALARLVDEGFDLLLAHPERYAATGDGLARLERWRETGVRFQVNYGSIAGVYGEDARRRSFALLARGWVDCLATDFHGRPSLRLFVREAEERIRRVEDAIGISGEAWELLTRINPERIVSGGAVLPVTPIPWEEGLWGKVTSLFRTGRR